MTKSKNPGNPTIDAAAEAAGRALGSIAGAVDSLKARHPHPWTEALDALAVGEEKLVESAAQVGARIGAGVKKTKAAARQTRKAASRVQSRGKKVVAGAARATRNAAARTKKAAGRVRKTLSRAASRVKR